MVARRHARWFVTALVGLGLVGCGGGGGAPAGTEGTARFQVAWPARSRVIPKVSESIWVALATGAQQYGPQIANRPAGGGTSELTFNSLPIGGLAATVRSFSQPNGQGTLLAEGNFTLTVTAGGLTTVDVASVLTSVVASVGVTPAQPSVAVGGTLPLAAQALDVNHNPVPVTSNAFVWQSLTGGVVSVSDTGVIFGVAVGTGQVRVTESESGLSTTVLVQVTAAP